MGLGKPGGIGTGSYNHTQPRKTESLSDLPCVPQELVCQSERACPRQVSLLTVCVSCPRVSVSTHTSGHAYISVHTPGHVCIHLSHHAARSTSVFPVRPSIPMHLRAYTHVKVCGYVSAGMCTERLYKSWKIFSGNGQQENNFSFAGHMVCVTTTQLCYYGKKAATNNE